MYGGEEEDGTLRAMASGPESEVNAALAAPDAAARRLAMLKGVTSGLQRVTCAMNGLATLTAVTASSAVDERVKNVQREHATPYVVLSGNVHAGQSKHADPLATAQRERLATERALPRRATAAAVDPAAVVASNASKVSFAMRPTKK